MDVSTGHPCPPWSYGCTRTHSFVWFYVVVRVSILRHLLRLLDLIRMGSIRTRICSVGDGQLVPPSSELVRSDSDICNVMATLCSVLAGSGNVWYGSHHKCVHSCAWTARSVNVFVLLAAKLSCGPRGEVDFIRRGFADWWSCFAHFPA